MPLNLFSFLRLFSHETPPFSEWLQQAQVQSGNKRVSLKTYQQARKIPLEALRRLYDHILQRDDYLERFYQTSLHYNDLKITDEPMPKSYLDNNTKVKYKNVIRHLHFRNILQKTKSGLQGLPSFLDVLIDLYTRHIIDYKIITPSALHYLEAGRIGSVFSSFYFRASIMNPYLVFSLNKSVLHGTRIFTPTLGWSSYAYGFAECPQVKEYVGVDVIPDVCAKTDKFLEKYPKIESNIFCQPSESLLHNKSFMTKYQNHFDVVFFSPPYYELEMYPGKNQSTTTYKTYEEWLHGYWHKTIQLCYHVLQPKGKMCYILSSGGGTQSVDILKDMNNITSIFFHKQAILPMYNKNVHVTSHRETSEKIMIYNKT
jgi:hypothetical protein